MSPCHGDVAGDADEPMVRSLDGSAHQSESDSLRAGVEAGLRGDGQPVQMDVKTLSDSVKNHAGPGPTRANRWWRRREGNNDKNDAEDTEASTPAESLDGEDMAPEDKQEEKAFADNDEGAFGTKESPPADTGESAPADSAEGKEQEEAPLPKEVEEAKETKQGPALSVEASEGLSLAEEKAAAGTHLGGAKEVDSLTGKQQEKMQTNTAEHSMNRSSTAQEPSENIDSEGDGEISKEEQAGDTAEGDTESTGVLLRGWDVDRGYTQPTNNNIRGRPIANWLANRRNRRTRLGNNDGCKGGEKGKQDLTTGNDDQEAEAGLDAKVIEQLDAKSSLRQRRRERRAAFWRALRENAGRPMFLSSDDEEKKDDGEDVASRGNTTVARRTRRERLQNWAQKARIVVVTASHMVKRASVGVAGACLVAVGIPLLVFPIPGPGVGMICGGLYVLSTEFDCTQDMLDAAKLKCAEVLRSIGLSALMLQGDSTQPTSLVLVGQPGAPITIPRLLPAPEEQDAEELDAPEEGDEDSEID